MKKVSVIIPAYNAERTIERCLTSILAANFNQDELEILVVNNNSTDQTCSLVEKFPVTLFHEKEKGPAYARNRGAREASGEFLAFLDADTYIEPEWFNELLKVFDSSLVGGACGPIYPCKNEGSSSLNDFRYRMIKASTEGTFNILELVVRESPMINSAACMYRREAFEFVGGFESTLIRHEDIDLSKRICVAGYDLALASKAECYVQFHGEGWGDYFARAWLHGFYKNDYIARWSEGINVEGEIDFPVETGEHKKVFKKMSYANSWWAIKNIVKFTLKSIIKRDSYWFILMLLDVVKIVGQLRGHYRREMFKPVIVKLLPKEKRIRKVKLSMEREITLADNIRIIRTPSPYLLDIARGMAIELKHNNGLAALFLLDRYMKVDTEDLYLSDVFQKTLEKSFLINKI